LYFLYLFNIFFYFSLLFFFFIFQLSFRTIAEHVYHTQHSIRAVSSTLDWKMKTNNNMFFTIQERDSFFFQLFSPAIASCLLFFSQGIFITLIFYVVCNFIYDLSHHIFLLCLVEFYLKMHFLTAQLVFHSIHEENCKRVT
jgi:hypothetical protein